MTPSLTLKLGHRKFRVVPFETLDGPDAGLIDYEAQTISIASTLTAEEQARVLIHELLHAAWDMAGNLGAALEEEAACEALDGPLATIFSDNPHLFGVLRLALNHDEAIVTLRLDGKRENPFSSLGAAIGQQPYLCTSEGPLNTAPPAPAPATLNDTVGVRLREAYAKWNAQLDHKSSRAIHDANVREFNATSPQTLYQQDERFFDYVKFGGPPGRGTQPMSSIEYALSACNNTD